MNWRLLTLCAGLMTMLIPIGQCAEKPIKAFILAGQSNMVGYGDSKQLPDELRNGNPRALMFENGKWQPLRQRRQGQIVQQPIGSQRPRSCS